MHETYADVIADAKQTEETIKEEAKTGWMFWVVLAFVAFLAWTTDTTGLIRGVITMTALGFYYSFRWHQETMRRLRLQERMLLALARRSLPGDDPAD